MCWMSKRRKKYISASKRNLVLFIIFIVNPFVSLRKAWNSSIALIIGWKDLRQLSSSHLPWRFFPRFDEKQMVFNVAEIHNDCEANFVYIIDITIVIIIHGILSLVATKPMLLPTFCLHDSYQNPTNGRELSFLSVLSAC